LTTRDVSFKMPYTPNPTCFQDFVRDASGNLPILVYRARPLKYDADYLLVIPSYQVGYIPLFPVRRTFHELELEESTDNTILEWMQKSEPLACIWYYKKGPCQWGQNGGGHQWTAVVRSSAYTVDELDFKECLGARRVSVSHETDFDIYTGSDS
jgi:hypothetical protein